MRFLKRYGLILTAIAFFFSVSAVTANAQYNRSNRNWNNRSWQQRQPNWNNRSWQNRRYNRISPQEYRRLSRQRSRIFRNTNRAYRDGYVNNNERRRLTRQYNNYRRNVRRDRRDWN